MKRLRKPLAGQEAKWLDLGKIVRKNGQARYKKIGNENYLAALAILARAALRREAVFFFIKPFLTALSYSD